MSWKWKKLKMEDKSRPKLVGKPPIDPRAVQSTLFSAATLFRALGPILVGFETVLSF